MSTGTTNPAAGTPLTGTGDKPAEGSPLPRNVTSSSRGHHYQVRFFECAAVPYSVLERILEGELSKESLRAFSQWRVDFPAPADIPVRSEREAQVLSVAEKILTRGRLTLCSPRLERTLRRKFLGRSRKSESAALSERMFRPPGDVPPTGRKPRPDQRMANYIWAIRSSHRIELTLLEALRSGLLALNPSGSWNVSTDLSAAGWFDPRESDHLLEVSIRDLLGLLKNLCRLYSLRTGTGASPGISISFTGRSHPSLPNFFIGDVSLPFHIAHSILSSPPAVLRAPPPGALGYLLRYIFRKPRFWEGQLQAVSRTLRGKDTIVLLPTGAGKSILFQLTGLLLPGTAIVIEPIISLMEDQIDNLRSSGIDRAVAITSQIAGRVERSRVLELFSQGEYLFAYIAPERFQTGEFREALRTLTARSSVSLIAVDEAHCVSEWGHDFRTAYLNIGRTSRTYTTRGAFTPPLIALTGTASRAVLKDVQRELQIEDFDAIVTPRSFDRPELHFHVESSPSKKKTALLISYLSDVLPSKFARPCASFFRPNGRDTASGLVFCPHVNGDFGVVEICRSIRSALGIESAYYSGKEPDLYPGDDWAFSKQSAARDFKHNRLALLVCTSAFGMGIDKPNIRFTVHFGIPRSIESFYQEAGRAGRDRGVAHCVILVSVDDPARAGRLLDPGTPPESISSELQRTTWGRNDDVTRAMYFQMKAFPGAAAEESRAASVLRLLGDVSSPGMRSLAPGELDRTEAEKAIHRLLLLGVVSDYTIDYRTEEFTVTLSGAGKESVITAYGRFVAGYLDARRTSEVAKAERLLRLPHGEFLLEMLRLLLRFIYDIIERGRRRALSEMLLAATLSPDDATIRARILRYLESTQYTEALEALLAGDGLREAKTLFGMVRSANEAAELRGQVSRYLESYPDHPGLLLVRALAETGCRDRSPEVTEQNFLAAFHSAEENYALEGPALFDSMAWAAGRIAELDLPLADKLEMTAFRTHPDSALARAFVQHSPLQLAVRHAWFLIDRLAEQSKQFTHHEEALYVPRNGGVPAG